MRVIAVAAPREASARPRPRSTWRCSRPRPVTGRCCGTSTPRARRRTATGSGPGQGRRQPAARRQAGPRGLRPRTPTTTRLDLLPADPSFRVVDTILSTRRWPDRVAAQAAAARSTAPTTWSILDCAPGLGCRDRVGDRRLGPGPRADHPGPAVGAQPGPARRSSSTTTATGLPLLAFLSMLDERKVLHRQMRRPGPRRPAVRARGGAGVLGGGAHGPGAGPRDPRLAPEPGCGRLPPAVGRGRGPCWTCEPVVDPAEAIDLPRRRRRPHAPAVELQRDGQPPAACLATASARRRTSSGSIR